MRKQAVHFKLIFAGIFIGLLFSMPAAAAARQEALIVKNTRTVLLGETPVKINVYEKKGSLITFVAPHFNERTGPEIARELIGKKGGRLVEIESIDENGNAL